jgi:hypothetical protein
VLQVLHQVKELNEGLHADKLMHPEIDTSTVVACNHTSDNMTLRLLPSPFMQQLNSSSSKVTVMAPLAGVLASAENWHA